jgi:hypothetical protein
MPFVSHFGIMPPTAPPALVKLDQLKARAEAAEALVGELEAEINQARRAWLGDDYGHLPLIEAMEKYRADVEARAERAEVRNARLVAAGNAAIDKVLTVLGGLSWSAHYGAGKEIAAWDDALADHAPDAAKTTLPPPADDDGLTDADFAELGQELKKSKHSEPTHPDTARLDWLEKLAEVNEQAAWRITVQPMQSHKLAIRTGHHHAFGTLRAAIDAAMQSAKEGQA